MSAESDAVLERVWQSRSTGQLILALFLEEWELASEEQRRGLPVEVRYGVTLEPRLILDKRDGATLALIEPVRRKQGWRTETIYTFAWCRSAGDLAELDRLVQELALARELREDDAHRVSVDGPTGLGSDQGAAAPAVRPEVLRGPVDEWDFEAGGGG